MATVIVTATAATQFADLPRPIQTRILGVFERLREWPQVSGAKPLRGALAGKYRVRTGDYRLQFRVDAETIYVEKIGHRDRFYGDKQ